MRRWTKGGYLPLKLRFGSKCPPLSTLKGWKAKLVRGRILDRPSGGARSPPEFARTWRSPGGSRVPYNNRDIVGVRTRVHRNGQNI